MKRFSKGEKIYSKKADKLPAFLERTEINSILNNAKSDNRRNYLMLQFLWRTGVRVGELVSLTKRDIKDGNIYIKQGKGAKDRVIPLDKGLDDMLGFYLDNLGPKDRIFGMTDRNVRFIINKYTPEGIHAHPHTFRHSFAVHCLKQGMNVRSLQKILGHSSLENTAIYLDIVAEDIKMDLEKVEF